jgi:hypothetical protein
MKETPSLAGGGVVALVELLDKIVADLTLDLLSAAEEQNSRAAVGLLVDLMNHAVENGHCEFLG